jgi:DNA-binding LacI/PurR family transcriptional regulator
LVSAETRARIERLAEEMGYSPDAQARSLVQGRTHTVGVVVTTITDPFIAELVQAIETAAYTHGYTVILASSNAEPEREIAAVDMLRSKRVDGVIVTSSRVGTLYQERLNRLGAPVVLVNSHSQLGGKYTFAIGVDNRHGASVATEHLIELGHRRIAYVTGPAAHSDDVDRLAGYRDALEQANIDFDPASIVAGTGLACGGEEALPQLLAFAQPVTAAFCYNDMTAIGLLRAARGAGLLIPEDLAVVGFDDIPLASYVRPSLTTIRQPTSEMGRQALQMVLALRSEVGQVRSEVSDVELRGELIVRESSITRLEG